MNILLIGGTGYIGSALFNSLSTIHVVDTVDLEWFGNFNGNINLKQDYDTLTIDFLSRYDIIVLTAANSSVALCKDLHDTMHI